MANARTIPLERLLSDRLRARRWFLTSMITITALVTQFPRADLFPVAGAARARVASKPNIVLILTDDQRADTLWAMPRVRTLIADRGIDFTHGYVVNPLCCPSRTSILTGRYSHSTGVYTNHDGHPYGGMTAFDDHATIATSLDSAGYRTGLFGKYLNGYKGHYVPPGWDRWFGTYGDGAYYDYLVADDRRIVHYGHAPSDYGTSVVGRAATDFIRSTDPSVPLFAYVAPHAPHGPAIPGPGDGHAFGARTFPHSAAFDEADIADKPAYIRASPRMGRRTAGMERFRLRQLRTLRSVDRMVSAIVRALKDTGRLHNTLLVFTSDNGMMWGEHRQHGKELPYEESVRVPFLVRYDAVVDAPRTDDHPVLNIDLAPTFSTLGRGRLPSPEGRDLSTLIANPNTPWRHVFLIEHLRDGGRIPTFCAVHTRSSILVWYGTGVREFYDLATDPGELRNLALLPSSKREQRALEPKMRGLCRPPPPGMSLPG